MAVAAQSKWELIQAGETRRVFSKVIKGIEVRKTEVFEVRTKSLGVSVARARWHIRGFRVGGPTGKFYGTWKRALAALNGTESE